MNELIKRRSFLVSGLTAACPVFADTPKVDGLVTGHAEGAEAGNAVLANGGNAIDAIVTAALVAGVVAVPATGIAGYGGHLVLAKPDGTVTAIDFNSTAPAAAKPDMFQADEQDASRATHICTGGSPPACRACSPGFNSRSTNMAHGASPIW